MYSNTKFKNIPKKFDDKIIYLTAEKLRDIFEKVKTGEWDMRNSTVFIQEVHNYMDSRNSASKQNKVLSYWILQSRHTGAGSCDIIYDTQQLGQVDLRLRRNTDIVLHPEIIEWEHLLKGKAPNKVRCLMYFRLGQRDMRKSLILDVSKTRNMYDTHEIVMF